MAAAHLERQGPDNQADEHAPCVTQKQTGRRKIVVEHPKEAASEDDRTNCDLRLAADDCHGADCRDHDNSEQRRDAVHSVQQIEGIDRADEPKPSQRHRPGTEGDAPAEQINIPDDEPTGDEDRGGEGLPGELPARAEAETIVKRSQDDDHGAGQDHVQGQR